MEVKKAVKLLKLGGVVREKSYGMTIYSLKNNEIYRKTLNFPWELTGNVQEFQKKFQNEVFEELVESQDHGFGFDVKS